MPKVNFAVTDDPAEVAGIGPKLLEKLQNGTYFPYKVFKISDIKKSDLPKLPLEAYLTITLTRGSPYTRTEVEKVGNHIIKKYSLQAELVGSYRRHLESLNDVDILATQYKTINPADDVKIIRSGNNYIKFMYHFGNEWYPVDVFFTEPERYPFALLHFTGSKEFNIHMSVHAIKLGYKLTVHGLYKGGKLVSGIKTEKDIFKKLGLSYLDPTQRTN